MIRTVLIAAVLSVPFTFNTITSKSRSNLQDPSWLPPEDLKAPSLPPYDNVMSSKIPNYRNWMKANEKPYHHYNSIFDPGLCRLPSEKEKMAGAIVHDVNPHDNFYLNVYVNNKGAKAMFTAENPDFPVGSVIVKEKYAHYP